MKKRKETDSPIRTQNTSRPWLQLNELGWEGLLPLNQLQIRPNCNFWTWLLRDHFSGSFVGIFVALFKRDATSTDLRSYIYIYISIYISIDKGLPGDKHTRKAVD